MIDRHMPSAASRLNCLLRLSEEVVPKLADVVGDSLKGVEEAV